jgi:hypothetical protein
MNECMTCDGTGFVTVKTPCKDPDHCIDGGPLSGVHELEIECPCCGNEDFEDEDDDDGEDD